MKESDANTTPELDSLPTASELLAPDNAEAVKTVLDILGEISHVIDDWTADSWADQ